jgi:hypothetical protein
MLTLYIMNIHSGLRMVFPTLNKEQTDDKIWAEHFRTKQTSGELNKVFFRVLTMRRDYKLRKLYFCLFVCISTAQSVPE